MQGRLYHSTVELHLEGTEEPQRILSQEKLLFEEGMVGEFQGWTVGCVGGGYLEEMKRSEKM